MVKPSLSRSAYGHNNERKSTSGKYQNLEKPLKHQRRLGLPYCVYERADEEKIPRKPITLECLECCDNLYARFSYLFKHVV